MHGACAPDDGVVQGIPIDDLLLTRERENQLTSLSGNAMTTTVPPPPPPPPCLSDTLKYLPLVYI